MTTFRRAACLAAILPLASFAALLPSTAASAVVTMPACPSGAVYAFDILGGSHDELAVYTVSPTETRVCLQVLGTGAWSTIVLHTAADVTPPSVSQATGTGTCATRIFDMTVPAQVHLSVGADPVNQAICVGTNNTTTTLTYAVGAVNALPSVEVWRSGTNTALDTAYCAFSSPSSGCTTTAQRIL
jgi:hypothetical protein